MKNKIQNLFLVITLLFFTGGLFSFSANKLNSANEAEISGGIYLTFANKHAGKVTQKDLQRTEKVEVDGCVGGARVFQYVLKITKNGKTKSYQGSSPKLTKTMLSDLRNLSKGDEFIFKKIKAYLSDGETKVDVRGEVFIVV